MVANRLGPVTNCLVDRWFPLTSSQSTTLHPCSPVRPGENATGSPRDDEPGMKLNRSRKEEEGRSVDRKDNLVGLKAYRRPGRPGLRLLGSLTNRTGIRVPSEHCSSLGTSGRETAAAPSQESGAPK